MLLATGHTQQQATLMTDRTELKEAKKYIKTLERELRRKDKALAEAAAILVLRKKLTAYWEPDNEEN